MKVLVAFAAAGVFASAYRSWEPARTFLSIASLGSVLFLAVFFVDAPIEKLSTTNVRAAPLHQSLRTPVVLVIFDEFAESSLMTPDGRIDAVRSPNFAALARSSTWYRSATTDYDYTTWAIPSILTGQRPRHDQLPLRRRKERNNVQLYRPISRPQR